MNEFKDPADPGLARALEGRYEIRIGAWIGGGWNLFTRSGGLFLAFAAIYWAMVHFAGPVMLVLGPVMYAGFLVAALRLRRGDGLVFADFWLPFNDFLPLFLAGLVMWVLEIAGLCTCGLLTIYLWVAWQFGYLLILDRRMDFWQALETSRKVATRHWFGLFAFALILLLINVATVCTFFLGLIVTLPLTACALVEAYADILGDRGGLPPGGRPPAPQGGAGAGTPRVAVE